MRPLPKPAPLSVTGVPLAPVDVFKLCISVVSDPELKARLRAIAPLIEAAAEEFDDAAAARTLHTIAREPVVGGNVTNKELVKVYTLRMARAGRPGRIVYEAILAGAPGDRCPLCGIGTVTTLDHHLPKAKYSRLIVTPNNLVPSCDWCQGAKRQAHPTSADNQTMHPYFDDFHSEQWLTATVQPTTPASFEFSVAPPAGWNATKAARARHHLKAFELDALYSSYAGEELTNIRSRLSDLLDSGQAASVRAHLLEEAASRRAAHLNSWLTAMYEAAANNDWFCAGGFAGV